MFLGLRSIFMTHASARGDVMRVEKYREKYRLRSKMPIEWYSMLATVDSPENKSHETEKKEEKA